MSDVPVRMKCGCTANAKRHMDDGTKVPSCLIHECIEIDKSPPDLTGRTASCTYRGSCRDRRGMNAYNGRRQKPQYGAFDPSGHSVAESNPSLAFFQHQPDHAQDKFYCGCLGWD